MCDAWRHSFAIFIHDMGPCPPNHTLDRKDNDGPYSPENCHWATRTTQNRNKRTVGHFTYKGKSHCLSEWAAIVGLPHKTVKSRIDQRWPIERALTTPVMVNQYALRR